MSSQPNQPSSQNANGGSNANTVLNGRYRLLAIIASGGMATVYKAQDLQLNRLVAVKMLRDRYARDAQFVQRFREEAQAAANLNHPNIVTIFDVGSDEASTPTTARHFIVMEYLEGADLKTVLREQAAIRKAIDINRVVDIARQICEGVGYAHRRGIVHCDLKPQNVIVSPEGHAEVADFGIARAYTASLNEQADVVWGTPQYFSPEQAAGTVPTPASDVYSIGVMLYEMLCGQLPFQAADAQQLARLHMTAEPAPLHVLNPNVTLQLEAIVRRAMSKDPAQRYASAEQLARVLGSYLQQGMENTLGGFPAVRPGVGGLTQQTPPTQAAPAPALQQTETTQPAQRTAPASQKAVTQVPVPAAAQSTQRQHPSSVPAVQATQRQRQPATRGGRSDATTVYTTSMDAQQSGGTDILLWLLGALAVLCLLGLIPLWVSVYQRYNAPPGARSLGAEYSSVSDGTTVTRTVDVAAVSTTGEPKIKVPALLGKSLEDATKEIVALGLSLRVTQEVTATDPGVTQTVVTQQFTTPDTLLAKGSTVDVGIRKPLQAEAVPTDLVGKILDATISQTLKSKGFNVVMSTTFSLKPEGEILATDPQAGTPLPLSGTLTLTVSNGGRIEMGASMPGIVVDWVKFNREEYRPGELIEFEVQWRATRNINRDYQVACFLLGNNGYEIQGRCGDRAPTHFGNPFPTSAWDAGTVVIDRYRMQIPAGIPSGAYTIDIGLYAGDERLRIDDAGQGQARNGLLVVRTLQIQ